MSVRLTLAKNGNNKVRTVAVVKKDDLEEVFRVARNKLKLKNPSRLFDPEGREIPLAQIASFANDSVLVVSCGEDFVGVVKEGASSTPSPRLEESRNPDCKIYVLAKASWIDDEAVQQLHTVARTLPGMRIAAGMPDLHAGRTFPVGAAFATAGRIYPPLIGTDIGCGMSLYQTDLSGATKPSKIVGKLTGLEGPWEGDASAWLRARDVDPTPHDASLGTIGGGNHFAELQRIEAVADAAQFAALGLSEDALYLLVHSGSRGFGEAVLNDHLASHGTSGLDQDTDEALGYLRAHEHACCWAKASRELIAHRTMTQLDTQGRRVLDVWHNNVVLRKFECGDHLWLHRKGAAPSDQGPVVIPGSRGSFSYLVLPQGDQEHSAYSLAHGAGRKWTRTKALTKLKDRYHNPSQLQETELGSQVICEDPELIYEEAPPAYKNVEEIVEDLKEAGLIQVIAIFRPVVTYKTR